MASSFYLGSVVEQSKWQKRELDIQTREQNSRKVADNIALEYEQLKDQKNAHTSKIMREVYKEIRLPSYSCLVPADGVQLLARAINSANNTSQPTSSLPANSAR
jgi:hypothetical protein